MKSSITLPRPNTLRVKYILIFSDYQHPLLLLAYGKGFCQVEKKSKNPRKTRIDQTPPTNPPIQFSMHNKNNP